MAFIFNEIDSKSEKRKFERLPIEFVLEVFAEDVEGINFEDKAVLEDVSGERFRDIRVEVLTRRRKYLSEVVPVFLRAFRMKGSASRAYNSFRPCEPSAPDYQAAS